MTNKTKWEKRKEYDKEIGVLTQNMIIEFNKLRKLRKQILEQGREYARLSRERENKILQMMKDLNIPIPEGNGIKNLLIK